MSQNIQKILVARLRHHGDLLLTTPVFSVLKNRYPHALIDAYIYEETAPILEGNPAIEKMILYSKQKARKGLFKIFYEIKILWRIFIARYDLVLNLTEGDRGALAAFVSRAKIRVGIDPEGSGMVGKKWLYTHLAKRCHHLRHTVERQLDVLRALDIFPAFEERELCFPIPPEAKAFITTLLAAFKITQPFIVVHPVSRWLFKCLPITTMRQVIDYLVKLGYPVILTASSEAQELKMNQALAEGFSKEQVIDLSGKLSLKELGALLEKTHLLVCVDSLPLHLASALKVPVVAMFGPTSDKTWAPWRNPFAKIVTQDYTCRPCYMPGCAHRGVSDCLETMSPALIIESIERMLQREVFTQVTRSS
jgi:heptosyltransferase-3